MFAYGISVCIVTSIALVRTVNLAVNWLVSCFCAHGLGKEAVATTAHTFVCVFPVLFPYRVVVISVLCLLDISWELTWYTLFAVFVLLLAS